MAIALDRVDRGDGESHRSGEAASDRSTRRMSLRAYTAFCVAAVVATAVLGHVFDAGDRLVALDRAGLAAAPTSRACSTTSRTRTRSSSRHHEPDRQLPRRSTGSSRCGPSSSRRRGRSTLVGLVAIAFLISGLRRAAIDGADARSSIGVVGEWPNAMDTLLAGARRDRADRDHRHRARRLGRREPDASRAVAAADATTSCRRCRSSSTSSRSSI